MILILNHNLLYLKISLGELYQIYISVIEFQTPYRNRHKLLIELLSKDTRWNSFIFTALHVQLIKILLFIWKTWASKTKPLRNATKPGTLPNRMPRSCTILLPTMSVCRKAQLKWKGFTRIINKFVLELESQSWHSSSSGEGYINRRIKLLSKRARSKKLTKYSRRHQRNSRKRNYKFLCPPQRAKSLWMKTTLSFFQMSLQPTSFASKK